MKNNILPNCPITKENYKCTWSEKFIIRHILGDRQLDFI